MLTEIKIFLISRELLYVPADQPADTAEGAFFNHMLSNDLKLMQKFEKKMINDKKFKKYVLNKKEITKNIFILNKFNDENDKYNAIIKIMNNYLMHLKKMI